MTAETYRGFLLDARPDVAELETLSLSHPDFTATHHLVRNHRSGFTGTLEDATTADFVACPMTIKRRGERDDMVQSLQVELGDVGEIAAPEIKRIRAADNMRERPLAKFRIWRHDDLSAPLIDFAPLEVKETARTRAGVAFEARAKQLNDADTGERFTNARFPMLRAFR